MGRSNRWIVVGPPAFRSGVGELTCFLAVSVTYGPTRVRQVVLGVIGLDNVFS